MIEDMIKFIEEEGNEEYETNHNIIRIKYLFRRYTVKVRKGVNFNQEKYQMLNRVLTKHYILYYMKC